MNAVTSHGEVSRTDAQPNEEEQKKSHEWQGVVAPDHIGSLHPSWFGCQWQPSSALRQPRYFGRSKEKKSSEKDRPNNRQQTKIKVQGAGILNIGHHGHNIANKVRRNGDSVTAENKI
jgi:hypothetical protein